MIITVIISIVFAQIVAGQLTIPLKRNCGCFEVPLTQNSNFVVTNNVGYQNLANQLAVGNTGLLVSNGVPVTNLPITNAILNAVQVAKTPAAYNIQVPLGQMPVCQENVATMAITPNNPGLNFGNIGSIANTGLGNIGLNFVPKSNAINVPVRLRRNVQKNNMFHSSLCNSGMTYDPSLPSL